MNENKETQILESLDLELRRGTIVLSVLSQLKQPQYGYSLVVLLEDKGFKIDPGTLYPLLRRLEKQELLNSHWDTEGTKPRKYYVLSDMGNSIYSKLTEQWLDVVKKINYLIRSEKDE